MLKTRRALIKTTAAFLVLCAFFFAGAGPCAGADEYKRTVEKYQVPDVTLMNQRGEKVAFRELVNSDKPVMLDFIYATCTTICPVLSAAFAHFQKKMGPEAADTHLVSISIDPDNDTPAVMQEYLERYDARPGWLFLTGRKKDIVEVMKAFDSFVVNKMNHLPLTILHAPGSDEWVRIYGLMSVSDLIKEYRNVAGR